MFYCKERGRLMKDWRDALLVLSECVVQLETCENDRDKFEERYEIAMSAREVTEQARTLLVRHRAEHGC
jgi:hypothetical protein